MLRGRFNKSLKQAYIGKKLKTLFLQHIHTSNNSLHLYQNFNSLKNIIYQ